MFENFLRSESGAVTTDFVVLTAGVVGLGLATVGVVTTGLETTSGDIEATLSGTSVNDSFARQSYFDDFENGSSGWIGAITDASDEWFGGILGPYSGSGGAEIVSRTYDLLSGYDYAVVEFDLHAIDSWDNEQFVMFVNGDPITSQTFQWGQDGTTGSWTTDDGAYSVIVEPNGDRAQLGYNPSWEDQSFSVRVEVADPGQEMTVGFGSTLNQETYDESWGVDNVAVTSTNDPGSI